MPSHPDRVRRNYRLSWFQRPYRVYSAGPDGWYFVAFGIAWRARGWRLSRWDR